MIAGHGSRSLRGVAESKRGSARQMGGRGINPTEVEAPRILLVEDDPEDAELVQEALSEVPGFSYTLTRAWRFTEAIELLERQVFDVALLDLWLPDASGFDTLAGLRGRSPGMPVVVLTGLDDESFGMEAVRHGAQDYLVKGRVDGPTLVRSISTVLARSRNATKS